MMSEFGREEVELPFIPIMGDRSTSRALTGDITCCLFERPLVTDLICGEVSRILQNNFAPYAQAFTLGNLGVDFPTSDNLKLCDLYCSSTESPS